MSSPRRTGSKQGTGGGNKAGAARGKGAKDGKKKRGGELKKRTPRRPGWDGLSMHERIAYVTFLVNVFHVSFFWCFFCLQNKKYKNIKNIDPFFVCVACVRCCVLSLLRPAGNHRKGRVAGQERACFWFGWSTGVGLG